MSDELKAQDCELEYWNQQAEDYAQVQIPCEDLRAIINRAWEAPAFNSALTAAEAERNRAQLACQQIAERLTASEARAKAAEEAHAEALLNPDPWRGIEEARVGEIGLAAFGKDMIVFVRCTDHGFEDVNGGAIIKGLAGAWMPIPQFRELKGQGQ